MSSQVQPRVEATPLAKKVMANSSATYRDKLFQSRSTQTAEKMDAVYRFIEDFAVRHGFSPVLREVADALGMTISGVDYYVDKLTAAGRVTRKTSRQRGIQIIDKQVFVQKCDICPMCKQVRL